MPHFTTLALPFGPYHPVPLGRIDKRYGYHPERLTVEFFDKVAKEGSSGFFNLEHNVRVAMPNGQTHTYLCAYSFKAGHETFTVLFPKINKRPRIDGADRKTFAATPVAIYCDREADDHWRTFAAEIFAETFVRFYKEHYSRDILASKRKNGIPVS